MKSLKDYYVFMSKQNIHYVYKFIVTNYLLQMFCWLKFIKYVFKHTFSILYISLRHNAMTMI